MNYFCDVERYNYLLKSEITKLTIIAIVLALIFIFVIVCSVIQIKADSMKKLPYIQLVLSVVIGMFLQFSLCSQINTYKKDITEKAYMQYEGPVIVREERQIIFGGIPTSYTEYIISFEQEGQNVELAMRKDYALRGREEKIYIVYARYSKFIFELIK